MEDSSRQRSWHCLEDFVKERTYSFKKRWKARWPSSTFAFYRWRNDPESIKNLLKVTQAVGGKVAASSPNLLAVKINDLSFIPYLMWEKYTFPNPLLCISSTWADLSRNQCTPSTCLLVQGFSWELKNLYLKFAFLSHLLSAQSVDAHA